MEAALYLPIFEALGHETRLKVFMSIYQSRKVGVRPKEIIEKIPPELALLLDSSLTGNSLLIPHPGSITLPPVEHLH